MKNKEYTLQDIKDKVSRECNFINSWELIDKADWHTINNAMDKIAELYISKATEELSSNICNHLAIVHADGGHHTAKVGIKQSISDADEKYYKLNAKIEELRKENEALREQVRQVLNIYGNVNAAFIVVELEEEIERLTQSNKELIESLKDSIERLHRARNILNTTEYERVIQKSQDNLKYNL